MQETPLLTVVAGYVELVQGETLTEAEVAEVARESVRTGRTARLARVRRGPQNERPAAAAGAVEVTLARQTAEATRPRRRDDARIVAPPRRETESALRAPSLPSAPSTPAIDRVGDVEIVAGTVVELVQDGNDVQDHVVEEVHREAATVVDVPNSIEVIDTLPEQMVAEGRPRRRREPVPTNGNAELIEV